MAPRAFLRERGQQRQSVFGDAEQWRAWYGQFLSFQQTYGYDNVNRLSQIYENPPGNASPYWYRTFNYDNFGNMSVSATSGLAAPALTPQASSAFSTTTNRLTTGSYDAAGNQTMFSNFTAAYDAENRQTTVTDGTSGNQMTYRYDGNGQRVIKGNTVFVYDAFSQLVAQYNNYPVSSVTCATCYLSVDHLGSTRLVTDGSANVVARHDHMPFGEELSSGVSGRTAQWDGQDGVTQKFTGQERDAETGLDFFQARYYSSAIGRFMSPDPANAGADPSNPQSWNGYGYVLNSPLIGVDPDGTDPYQGSGDDPCDDDPFCGLGEPGFPFGYPSSAGPSQPPPPPYTPPMAPIPNTTGVYGQGGWGTESLGLPPGLSVPNPLSPQVLLSLWDWDCSGAFCVPGFLSDSYQSVIGGGSGSGGYWAYAGCLTFSALPKALFTGATGIGGTAVLGRSFSEPFVTPPGIARKVAQRAATKGLQWGTKGSVVGAVVFAASFEVELNQGAKACSEVSGYTPWILR